MRYYVAALLVAVCCFGESLSAQVPNRYITAQTDLPCVQQTVGLRIHLNYDVTGPKDFDTVAFKALVRYTNTLFAPICLQFEACEFLTVENYRYSSHERNDAQEQVSLYGDPNRIDVYVTVRDSATTRCGLSSLGGISKNRESYIELVNDMGCLDSTNQTLAHELGRFLGLRRTFDRELGEELVNGSNCATAGDLICDTPADPYVEDSMIDYVSPDDPCRFTFGGQDANGQYYVPHTGNVMSLYDPSCRCSFTHDQLLLMAKNFEEFRDGIW